MGNRVSISFRGPDGDKSVVLFSHWGGMTFVRKARIYARLLEIERGFSQTMPLDRLEPNTVMVDFIRALTKTQARIESDLYLGATETDGDNSDYGHHVIFLKKLGSAVKCHSAHENDMLVTH